MDFINITNNQNLTNKIENSDESSFSYSSDSDFSDSVSSNEPKLLDIPQMAEDILSEDAHSGIGVQTYIRSQNWATQETYNPLNFIDHFQYFPTDEGFSSDMFFEVFSSRQKKASTNSMTQISLLNDKVQIYY